MKICVAGMGLIGGSICMALKRTGYAVFGWNRSEKPLQYALSRGIVDGRADNLEDYDVVFVALPPETTLAFINDNSFKPGAILSDICGVKQFIEDGVYSRPRRFRYVGTHPMAGKEVSGVENASEDLFDGANMVITRDDRTDSDALQVIRRLTEDMGFGRIVECSAAVHDRKIGYTSQLAHVVSNAYVKNTELSDCLGFTGGSFQDMTRIAGVDETMWSSLYLKNAENIVNNIDALLSSLGKIREAIAERDRPRLEKLLAEGRELFENHKKFSGNDAISVTKIR